MSTLCVNNQQKTFLKRLTCVMNYTLGNFGPFLLKFHLQSLQTLVMCCQDLALKVSPDAKVERVEVMG